MLKHALIFLFLSSSLFYVTFGAENPFTPKASALRYWSLKIPNNLPKPSFLLAKLSPLSAQNSAILQKLADQNALSTQLPSFCSWAHLFCFPDLAPSLAKHDGDSHFAKYSERNFTNYGTRRIGGSDTFKNYSDGINIPNDSFQRYSRDSIGHTEKFSNYAPDGNVASGEFNSYAGSATGGSGQFANYDRGVNVPDLKFSNYDSDGLGRPREFTSYSDVANAGDQRFTSYGKRANAIPTSFTSYGRDSNVIGSTFLKYGESGNAANDTFTSYGFGTNVPENTFRSYGDGGNAAAETFTSYRDTANVGDDKFTSYAKGATFAKANFVNYGNSANVGSDTFTGYGRDGTAQQVGFKIYGENVTFKDYAKKGISFAKYRNSSSLASASHWHVEEGKFFRESNLRSGTVMKMPDISDKMPARSFLPRSISQKIPFTTTRVAETLKIFNSDENSTMADIVGKTLKECEREPSRGETKRCVASAEDMIDFAVEVLGRNLTAKSTEGLGGSNRTVQIGTVTGINGGKITKSVSCHQSLFPYLVYFCHSVPKVRVYEAEILDHTTKEKINRGVAICHIDTSAWGASHAAFIAVGGGPGKVEVCHWIFENDLTWVTAD